jgi:haloacid dehalogenase superfamily, subfamily IA, variant 1 with third motif having Dx(3-4)D or Dx(3-4)E
MAKAVFPTKKKALLFDWHGTLVLSSSAAFDRAFVSVLEDWTGRWSEADGASPARALAEFKAEWKQRTASRNRVPTRTLFAACLKKALAAYPLPTDAEWIERFRARVQEEKRRTALPLPGVRETLSALSGSYRMAVISNGGGIDLERSGLSAWLRPENCFTSQMCGYRKPHPAIFAYALKKLNIPASRSVMIGDSWNRDVRGAVASGIDAVWIRPGGSDTVRLRPFKGRTVAVVRDFRQLSELF